MANITLSMEDEIIRKVRKIAIDENTTLSQMVREFLTSVAQRDAAERERAAARLERSFERLGREMGLRRWTREELHERR